MAEQQLEHGGYESDMPTVVSFYSGDSYYAGAAQRLRANCVKFGLRHHIEQLPSSGLSWPEICRLKVGYYQRMHQRFGSILWIDADDQMVKPPTILAGSSFDVAGFVGRRVYVRDYDPYNVTRFWLPSILYFGPTEPAARFIDGMVNTEASALEDVTDDWVLHETWLKHTEELHIGLLAPKILAKDAHSITSDSVFVLGHSGQVGQFKSSVAQHTPRLQNAGLRARALGAESIHAMKEGDRTAALVLAERAHRHMPSDAPMAIRYSNYLQIDGQGEESETVLRDYIERQPGHILALDSLVKRALRRQDFDAADDHLQSMRQSTSPEGSAVADSWGYEVHLERRAVALGIDAQDRPQMWWNKGPYSGTFGDIIGPWIVEQITGNPPRWCGPDRGILAGGSNLHRATGLSRVWGSGLLNESESPDASADYRAVRGPAARRAVQLAGGRCPAVYGDPTLLLPRFIPHSRQKPTYRLGLVRHATHEPVAVQDVKDIQLEGMGPQLIERVVREILECEFILSTSLYGIMVAHAYGIPARWCRWSMNETGMGDGIEFDDYFRSVGLPPQTPYDLSGVLVIDDSLVGHVPAHIDIEFDAEGFVSSYW